MPMPLPTVGDFTVTEKPEEDLHGCSAWKAFGGLSIEEAYRKFCEVPEAHQEDFMWMGDRAFMFYFSVIERYLHDEEPRVEFDGVTFILAHCIGMHLPSHEPCVRSQYDRFLELGAFVLDNLRMMPEREARSHSILEVTSAWSALQAKVV
jgi:hypothetical protein